MYGEAGNIITGGQVVTLRTALSSINYRARVIRTYMPTLPEELIESVTMWPVFLLYAKVVCQFQLCAL